MMTSVAFGIEVIYCNSFLQDSFADIPSRPQRSNVPSSHQDLALLSLENCNHLGEIGVVSYGFSLFSW